MRDDEASQQVESTQLAAAEIERLVEDKQRLAEHLQQEVLSGLTLAWFLILFPSYSCFFAFKRNRFFVCVYIERHQSLQCIYNTRYILQWLLIFLCMIF